MAKRSDPITPAHDIVYRTLRREIMFGERTPGEVMTIRGIADLHQVSMTPVREALRRLVAEGALVMSVSGRVSTPELTNDRIEELAALRALIEVELASRALPRAHLALVERLQTINNSISSAVAKADAVAYIRSNLEFHRTLYLRAQAPAMLATVETVWLQLGPTMRALYGKMRQSDPPRNHRLILSALRAGDEPGLRIAVRADVTHGLRLLAR
ncbi:MAG: GntR family transcriptional regulator [Pseudomonadota bacterium]